MKTLDQVIEQSKGKIFSVIFITNKGTLKRMVARVGVTVGLKGGTNSNNGEKYLTVYDMHQKGYRNVSRENIREVRFGGRVYRDY